MQNKNYTIYKVTNTTNNKCYIGLTSRDFETRRYEHIYESKGDSVFKFHQALRKYSYDNFTWEILESGLESIKIANEREMFYIKKFNSYSNGYNMTKGGGGRDNYFFSSLARERMRQAKLGTIRTQESKEKQSKKLSGVKKSEEHRLNVIKSITGLKRSEDDRLKMSERMKNKFTKDKNPAAIKIIIYDKDNNVMFTCNGNFEYVCNENGLPTKALRKSYYDNGKPIYMGKTIKKEVLLKNQNFIGWYAIKIDQ
jgi:group I intron endonuclease